MTIAEMRSRLDEIDDELQTLPEELDEEQSARFDELKSEADGLIADVERAEERAETRQKVAEAARNAKALEAGAHNSVDAGDPLAEPESMRDSKVWDLEEVRNDLSVAARSPQGAGQIRGRALTAIERAKGLNDPTREKLSRMVEWLDFDDEDTRSGSARLASHLIATSSPDYLRAWKRAFKATMRGGQDPEALQTLQRAASLTDAAGGYAVPLPVDPTLIINDDGSTNPFRDISTVKTIVTDQLRTVNSGVVSFSWDGEAGEVSDDATTFGNVDISVHKLQGFVPFSIEIGMDYPGWMEDLGRLFREGRDNAEATAFATGAGDGSNQPVGIVTALSGGSYEVSSNSTDTFALSDVYDLEEELPERFQANATWVANKRIYQAVREAGGANLDDFWANLGQGRPNELLGYPAREASAMDGTINATADNRVLVFGDFRNYWIVDRAGFSLEMVPHLFATGNNRPSGQRGLYGYVRVGADSTNDRAFRLLNVT